MTKTSQEQFVSHVKYRADFKVGMRVTIALALWNFSLIWLIPFILYAVPIRGQWYHGSIIATLVLVVILSIAIFFLSLLALLSMDVPKKWDRND